MHDEVNKVINLYPSTKFFALLFIAISVMIVPGYLYAYMIYPVCLLIAYLAKRFKTFFSLTIKSLLLIVIFIFILQSVFIPGEDILWSYGIVTIKGEGIIFSLYLTSKIVAIGSAMILFFQITSVKDITYALEVIGTPPKVSFVVLSTLKIIPEMQSLTYTIMDAQKTRGVETEGNLRTRIKAFLPILSPIILGSIANTEERVLTLESRAFMVKGNKTSVYHIQKSKIDHFIVVILFILLVLIIIWRVAHWI